MSLEFKEPKIVSRNETALIYPLLEKSDNQDKLCFIVAIDGMGKNYFSQRSTKGKFRKSIS